MKPADAAVLLNATSSFQDGATFTKTIHKEPYPAIYPTRPELSQAGRTVLITGGSAGIGFAIARSFAQAGAKRVIILGRRQNLLDEAVSKLQEEYSAVQIEGKNVDVSDLDSTEALWKGLENDGVLIDVLVLNAASMSSNNSVMDLGRDEVWNQFTTNVRSHMDFTERFYKQKGGENRGKFLLNVSTAAIHDFVRSAGFPGYSTTKNAGTILMQMIAKDTPPEKMQVISYHPGTVYTDSFVRLQVPKELFASWDDVNLGGNFAVWAASEEARFLHGRFVWAGWDVDELRNGEIREKIETNGQFLKVGVVGLQE